MLMCIRGCVSQLVCVCASLCVCVSFYVCDVCVREGMNVYLWARVFLCVCV